MAKKYLEIFRDSAETQYASGAMPLVGLAALNEGIRFTPIPQSNGSVATAGKAVEFAIQRMKRIKAVDSPLNSEATAETAAGSAFGDDLVKGLNALTKVEWDTVDTKTGVERIIGVTVEPREEVSPLEDASAYSRTISNKVRNTLMEAEEVALAKVVSAAGTPVSLDLSQTPKQVADVLRDEIFTLQELVDDFKAYSDGIVGIVHPRVAKLFADLEGQGYQTGTNTFPEGLGKGFRYDGIDFFVDPMLNSAVGSGSGKVISAIIMDKEAYANAGTEKMMVEFDETYLGTRAVGHRYNSLDVVIDPARIKVFESTLAKSKKVNE